MHVAICRNLKGALVPRIPHIGSGGRGEVRVVLHAQPKMYLGWTKCGETPVEIRDSIAAMLRGGRKHHRGLDLFCLHPKVVGHHGS
jgi:hypothetical protein